MSRADLLRQLVMQRLTKAADDICDLFLRTLEEEQRERAGVQQVSDDKRVPRIQSQTGPEKNNKRPPVLNNKLEVYSSQKTLPRLLLTGVHLKTENQEHSCVLRDHLELLDGEQKAQQRSETPTDHWDHMDEDQMEEQEWEPPVKREKPEWALPVKQELPESVVIKVLADGSSSPEQDLEVCGPEPDSQSSRSSDCQTEDSDDDDWNKPKKVVCYREAVRTEPSAGPKPAIDPVSEDKTPDSSGTEDSDEDSMASKHSGSASMKGTFLHARSSEPWSQPLQKMRKKKKKKSRTMEEEEEAQSVGLQVSCPLCGKVLMHKSSLRRHQKSYCRGAPERPDQTRPAEDLNFHCSMCSHSFTNQVCLDLHQRMHRFSDGSGGAG